MVLALSGAVKEARCEAARITNLQPNYSVESFLAAYQVPADDKKAARLNTITHLLLQIPYKTVVREKIELPPRADLQATYVRPPIADQTFVTRVF